MSPRPPSRLAAARRRAGHSQESLAVVLGVSRTTVAGWERGTQGIYARNLVALARALGCSVEDAEQLVGATGREGSQTSTRPHHQTGLVEPGSRGRSAVSSAHNPIEHFLRLRACLVEADALYGGGHVLAAVCDQAKQLERLRAAAPPGDVVAVARCQAQFAELASWIAEDLCDYNGAVRWLDQALTLAGIGQSPDVGSYVLARRSQLAAEMLDADGALTAADQARRLAPNGSRSTVMADVYEANGLALTGDLHATETAHARSLNNLEVFEARGDSPGKAWLTPSYLEAQHGNRLLLLGRPVAAARSLETALRHLPDQYRRERGLHLARAARAQAQAGSVDRALELGTEALTVIRTTSSNRLRYETEALIEVLAPLDDPLTDDFCRQARLVLAAP